MNISFSKLGNEQCEKCEEMNLHNTAHKQVSPCDNCDIFVQWKQHMSQAQAARHKYREDVANSVKYDMEQHVFMTADLQKVIMLPRLEMFKTVLFTRWIIAFNECFVPVGKIIVHRGAKHKDIFV